MEQLSQIKLLIFSLVFITGSCTEQTRSGNANEASSNQNIELKRNSQLHGTWVRHTSDGFTLIEIQDSLNVSYYQFIDRGPDWGKSSVDRYSLYKSQAKIGFWDPTESDIDPDIWISTDKFRFDYKLHGDTLIEIDKMGEQGRLLKVYENGF